MESVKYPLRADVTSSDILLGPLALSGSSVLAASRLGSHRRNIVTRSCTREKNKRDRRDYRSRRVEQAGLLFRHATLKRRSDPVAKGLSVSQVIATLRLAAVEASINAQRSLIAVDTARHGGDDVSDHASYLLLNRWYHVFTAFLTKGCLVNPRQLASIPESFEHSPPSDHL